MDRAAIDEIKRHFAVLAEELGSQVRAVAEGQASHRQAFDAFRIEAGREFAETRALIRRSPVELDRRALGSAAPSEA